MKRLGCLVVIILWISSAALADAPADAEARAKAISPYVDSQTLILAHVDFTRLNPEALIAKFAEPAKLAPQDIAVLTEPARQWLADFTKAGGKDLYVVASMADFPGEPFVIVPLDAAADARALSALMSLKKTDGTAASAFLPFTA
jgi:hypothetical protein